MALQQPMALTSVCGRTGPPRMHHHTVPALPQRRTATSWPHTISGITTVASMLPAQARSMSLAGAGSLNFQGERPLRPLSFGRLQRCRTTAGRTRVRKFFAPLIFRRTDCFWPRPAFRNRCAVVAAHAEVVLARWCPHTLPHAFPAHLLSPHRHQHESCRPSLPYVQIYIRDFLRNTSCIVRSGTV